ncbi:MAG: hypothetical protein IJK22_10205 [Bacteroidales bacterium]|jgi:hypothetical protein|nr:hypothetical protein [Bacteroidales bacterium]
MKENEVKQTLDDIREMMSKSSRFQAISGWSIIVIGLLAGIASLMAAAVIGVADVPFFDNLQRYSTLNTPLKIRIAALIALILFTVCLIIVFVFAIVKSKRHNLPFAFDKRMRQMLLDFFIPLIAGGLFSMAMVMQQHYGLTSSIMLMFYGLALINCSHYTYPILRWLGYTELLIGIIDCFTMSHALLFWFLGFSVAHILFGIIYVLMFDRKNA